MTEKSTDIKAIFAEALDKRDPKDRAAYLDQACGVNTGLRDEIEGLLTAHGQAGAEFLKSSPASEGTILDIPTLTEGPGTIIGAYKLQEEIGEGGMAVVYMAQQDSPLRRRVALKIIKAGMDTRQVIARFEAERQALALMDHPNIAKVFDAGTTETGRSFFVMELVRGVSITKYCDKNKLKTQQRLELFIKVCNAVHHAHQKGIIHRDLKPSNIMVTMHDGIPVPKVIDFGIAKATNQRLTEHTVFTRYAEMIGTPEYMSPEQAEMSELDIDTRTDIYSLGIVLYELLTGTLPFDAKTLRCAGFAEIQRIIREDEPLRPSTRISTLGVAAQGIAACRCTNATALAKRLSRELEWIPMKAMRKDRTRRYRSASEFADDVQNYLHDTPLLAGPESTLYRLRKAVHKHRVPVMAVTAVIAALTIGLFVSTSLYVRMRRALNTVSQWENKAEIDSQLSSARRLYDEGRYQAALQEIEVALDTQDLGPEAHLLRAQLRLEIGQFKAAEDELLRLTQAEAEVAAAAHALLARAYLTVDSAKADQHEQLAEAMLPETAEAFSLRAMTVGTPDKALVWLSRALELDPKHYAARKARAFAKLSLRAYQDMTEDVGGLIVLRAHDYLGYALRAIVHRESGQFALALKDHDRAIALCSIPDELPRLYDQRRETHMRSGNYQAALEDARQYAGLNAEEPLSRFPIFTALLALGEYDAAQTEYEGLPSNSMIKSYVFELLGTGQPLVLPPDLASRSPFFAMQEIAQLYARLESKGRPLHMSSEVWLGDWSPDGQQIAYARYSTFNWQAGTLKGIASKTEGTRGLEIMDLESGKTRLLTRFGMYPVWSPNGKHIAFTEHDGGNPAVWLIPSTGGQPRKLTQGYRAHWAQDSGHILFRTRSDGTICSIAIDQPDAEPVPVLAYPGHFSEAFATSPDESLIAIEKSSEIRVLTLPEGKEVARWDMPWPLESWTCQLQWHPDGKTILAAVHGYGNPAGICLFNLDQAEPSHVFNLSRPMCKPVLSPDGSRIIASLGVAVKELWLLDIDPTEPLAEALSPSLTREEFLAWMLENWNQRIAADALNTHHYLSRALVHLAAEDLKRAEQDIEHCSTLINDANDPALNALQLWAGMYIKNKRYAEAELLAHQNAQLAERFPGSFRNPPFGGQHPFQQLALIYAARGDKSEAERWRKKHLQITASTLIPGRTSHN
jgi:serine/threonine protein kinase